MTMPSIASVSSGQTITASGWNTAFNTVRNHYNANAVELDGSQTLTGVKTFSATPVLSSGITVTGNSTIAGTLTSLTGITSSGTAALATVTVSATLGVTGASTMAAISCTTLSSSGGITGTLQTAAQTNITSVGTLSALTVSGTLTLSQASPLSLAATAKFVAGATSFAIKDSGDSVSAFGMSGTGTSTAVTMACGSSGAITITGPGSASVTLSLSNVRLNATNGLILLGTDGTNPIGGTATTGFPAMPWVNATPTGILSSAKIGAFQLDEANGCLAIWTSLGWRKIAHASY